MDKKESKYLYDKLRAGWLKYDEKLHCPMILEFLPRFLRINKFFIEAGINQSTFYEWVSKYPVFRRCYEIAKLMAVENWEYEEARNESNPKWDRKAWLARGARYFAIDREKIKLNVKQNSSPLEQYQQILSQANEGDFTASEIKQLMESVNVGIRAYESYKMQEEVDRLKEDLKEMSQRHGNNIIPITQAQDANKAAV